MDNPLDSAEGLEALPIATHTGILTIAKIPISCAVLEDDRRVLTQSGFLQALGRNPQPKAGQGVLRLDETPSFLAANNLKPFVSHELLLSTRPIVFRHPVVGMAYGYKAELLPEVCEVFLKARDAKELHHTQIEIAARCELLVRGLARVGITALVDEATGYQYARARNALEDFLDKFLTDELQKWRKTFPDEFYIQLYRLKGWKFDDVVPTKRPQVIGHITNDIVYSRLAPGVLDQLKQRTPRDEKGRHKDKFHQRLTLDVGHPALRDLLSGELALMRVSSNWQQFYRNLEKAFPKLNSMEPLFYPDELENNGDITKADFEKALGKVSRIEQNQKP